MAKKTLLYGSNSFIKLRKSYQQKKSAKLNLRTPN